MCPALLALVSPHQRLFVESELIDRGKANQPEKRNRKQQREPIKCCVFLHLHLFPSAISNFSYRNIRILTRHFSFFQSLCSAKLVSWMYFILRASVHIELFYRQSWEKKRFTCSSSFLQQYLHNHRWIIGTDPLWLCMRLFLFDRTIEQGGCECIGDKNTLNITA